jgi:hypothetical protein
MIGGQRSHKAEGPESTPPAAKALLVDLSKLGYIDGQNIIVEW